MVWLILITGKDEIKTAFSYFNLVLGKINGEKWTGVKKFILLCWKDLKENWFEYM